MSSTKHASIDDLPLTEFIRPTDEVTCSPRPSEIDTFHLEHEYDYAADGQRFSHAEEGLLAAKEDEATAREFATQSAMDTRYAVALTEASISCVNGLTRARSTLSGLAHRSRSSIVLKNAGMLLLFIGDFVGIAGAAMLLGEEKLVAYGQAIGVGASVVIGGLLGRELRHGIDAKRRQKDPGSLSEDETHFGHLFSGSSGLSRPYALSLLAASFILSTCIGAGIFMVRAGAEGKDAGIGFALFAGAMAIASVCLNYCTADEIDDVIRHHEREARRAQRATRRAGRTRAIREYTKASRQADTILAAHEEAGRAAEAAVHAAKYAALGRSVVVAGHGFPPKSPAPASSAASEARAFSGGNAPTVTATPTNGHGDLDPEELMTFLNEI